MVDSSSGMRTIVTIISAVVSVFVLAAPSSVAAGMRHGSTVKCGAAHGRVIAADQQAQLYIATDVEEYFVVRGCVYGHRGSYELGYQAGEKACSSSGCLDIHRETLAGPIVAYEYFSSAGEAEAFLVIVRDLRNGRVLHRVPTGIPRPENASKVIGAGFASVIVVKPDGAVAWINEHPLGRLEETEYEVHALDGIGNRVLASGTDIGARSLALAGNTLYWTQGGQPHSAILY